MLLAAQAGTERHVRVSEEAFHLFRYLHEHA